MNALELMEGKLAVMVLRVEKLEALLALDADDLAAQRTAQEHGFAAEIFRVPHRLQERKELAGSLRAMGWSYIRIARAFRVSERTAERWLAKPEDRGSKMVDGKGYVPTSTD